MKEYLSPLLKSAESLPYLFLGSGFSRRYLNIPTWQNLLDKIAEITYSDPYKYISVQNSAAKKYDKEHNYNSYMTYLCDLISEDLDAIWYSDDRFSSNREKYKSQLMKKNIAPIKIEISEYISSFQETLTEMDDEIQELKTLSTRSVAGIITTNYDSFIESIFNYETYPSQEELLFHSQYTIGEIYKIHGCISRPETILVNTRDYKKIEEKHKYLSAKLLTIFIEHPVFFIGYSIGDEDIKAILSDIQQCLSTEQLKLIQDRLFFIVWDKDIDTYRESSYPITFQNGSSLVIKQIRLNDFSLLYKIMAENKSKYPVKILRHMKQDMYNMVLTNDPTNRMLLALPNEEMESSELEDIEFLYGFGMLERAKHGYSVVSSEAIFEDILFNSGNFLPQLLVQGTLPYALQKAGGYIPIRKYTSQVEESDYPESVVKNLKRFNSVNSLLSRSLLDKKRSTNNNLTFEQALTSPKVTENLAIVNYSKDTIEKLGDYLKTALKKEQFTTENSNYRRLIRIYDFIKYQ